MRLVFVALLVAGFAAAGASAQNSAGTASVAASPAGSAPKADSAPIVIAPPPPVVNEVSAVPAANDTVVTPQQQQVPTEAVPISPDAQYPNGFADPDDPFANDAATAAREESGFSWGLLGLLGLLGLIPLFRKGGKTRTVYVDRDDPKRVLREEEE